MTVTAETRTQREIIETVRVTHVVKTARRDEQGRLAGTDEVSWVSDDSIVPASAVAAIVREKIEEAKRIVEAEVVKASPATIEGWLARRACVLPDARAGELVTDLYAELRAAIADGRIDAEVFVLPRLTAESESEETHD